VFGVAYAGPCVVSDCAQGRGASRGDTHDHLGALHERAQDFLLQHGVEQHELLHSPNQLLVLPLPNVAQHQSTPQGELLEFLFDHLTLGFVAVFDLEFDSASPVGEILGDCNVVIGSQGWNVIRHESILFASCTNFDELKNWVLVMGLEVVDDERIPWCFTMCENGGILHFREFVNSDTQ